MKDIGILTDKLASLYFNDKTPSCSLLAALDGKVIFRKAYGMADIENGIPAKSEDNYIIASNTKQFACLAILMLRDRGLLALDETIERFFPDFPDYCKTVTVRMLMNHTSGIPDYFEHGFTKLKDQLRDADTAALLEIAKSTYGETEFEPGTKFSYSNTAYVMLGDIVRQLSGKKFGNFIETEIFAPLGMNRSFAPDYMDQKDPYQVEGYANAEGGEGFSKVAYDMLEIGYADGNISSNVDDLLKWHAFLYGGDEYGAEIIDKSHLKELYTPSHLKDGTEISYCLGIIKGDLDEEHKSICGCEELWHTGGTAGFISRTSYLPEHKVSLIVLTNWLEVPRDELFSKFADAVLSCI